MPVDRKLVNRGAWLVLATLVALATIPFYLSGRITRNVITAQVARIAASSGIPISLQLTKYRLGLYASNFDLLLILKTQTPSARQAVLLHGNVAHGFSSSSIKMAFDPDALRKEFSQIDIQTPSPMLYINTDINLVVSPQWGMFITGNAHLQPLQITSRNSPAALNTQSINISFEQRANGISLDFDSTSARLHDAATAQATFDDVRARIAHHNNSADTPTQSQQTVRSKLTLTITHGNIQAMGALIEAKKLQFDINVENLADDPGAQLVFTANEISSQGVPYLKLTNPNITVTGHIRPGTDAAKRQIEIQHSAYTQSNFGRITSNGTVRTSMPTTSPDSRSPDTCASVDISLPSGLLNLLLKARPALRKQWIQNRLLSDDGNTARISAQWKNGRLQE